MLNTTTTAKESLGSESTMGCSTRLQYSAISGHSSMKGTPMRTREWLMSLREGSHVSRSAVPLEEGQMSGKMPGQRCWTLSEGSARRMSLRKMLATGPCPERDATLSVQVIKYVAQDCQPPQWVRHIAGVGNGLLATLTATANQLSPSMRKWRSCAAFQDWHGGKKMCPEKLEWYHAMPTGWTALEPLETGRYQQWLRQHGVFCSDRPNL